SSSAGSDGSVAAPRDRQGVPALHIRAREPPAPQLAAGRGDPLLPCALGRAPMIERIDEYAARHFGGVGRTVASFVRLHVWALVFLIILSVLAPAHMSSVAGVLRDTPSVHSVAMQPGDPQAYAPTRFDRSRFRIAWIMASEGGLYSKPFLTGSV